MLKDFLQKRSDIMGESDGIRGATFYGVTLGRVVSTDDPQQMGRLYVLCPELGDPPDLSPEDFTSLPLCTYMSPFGGVTESDQARGPEDTHSKGPITYGMWAIPKRGAIVGVMCINGNPAQRVWVGSVFEQYVTNTMPHGRFFFQDQDGAIPHPQGAPYGPVTATENPIQPIYDNQTAAFKSRLNNFEWRTRGADFQNTGVVSDDAFQPSPCNVKDDLNVDFPQEDGTTISVTQGMMPSRDNEGVNDNQVYSWTTPGFHTISMDDRGMNCRIKLRTSAGHQIIMDDTNERIYINTAKGNNWIEIDEDGCIDIFSTEKISATAKHINFTAEETLRLYGKTGVHIKSDADIRIQAGTNIEETAGTSINVAANGGHISQKASANFELQAMNINQTASSDIALHAGTNFAESAGGDHTTKASAIKETAGSIDMNSDSAKADVAPSSAPTTPEAAFFTNRYPQHEPWARTSTKTDNAHDPKYPYNDPAVGREHKTRGKNWRR
jgi:hypothetical protein